MGEWIGGGSGPARRLSARLQPQNGSSGRDAFGSRRGVRSGSEFEFGLGGGSCRCDRWRPRRQTDAFEVGPDRGRLRQGSAGDGTGSPTRTGTPRCEELVVGIGHQDLASVWQAPILGPSTWRTAGARRAWSLVVVGGAGGRLGARETVHVPPMRSEADGRRSSSTAASSDRDPTGAGLRHRVSI